MSEAWPFTGVALECPDPRALARFYSAVTGWPIVYDNDDWCSLGADENASFHLSFQRAPDHVPPRWPDPESSMQFHLHFRVDDPEAAERRVIGLGATKYEHQPNPTGSTVYADPAGHPFCLCG